MHSNESKFTATKELRKQRKAKSWTVQEMVSMFNLESGQSISQSLYEKWEASDVPLSADSVLDLSRLLRVEPGSLVRK